MEIKDIKVSIITPVYNMDVLLPKCIESILGQTYSNIELILVDDGSIDNSGSICDEYAQKDKRVRTIHQKNGGIACAINTGLNAITGKFLLFVDSDDYIAPTMVERLLGLMIEYEADVVQCDTYTFKSAEGINIVPQPNGRLYFFDTRDEILDDFFHYRRISRNLAARLFKTSLFDGIRCEPGRMIIDVVTLPRILIRCNKYIYVDEKYYYVYTRSTSVSRMAYSLEQWVDCKHGNSFIEQLVKENCPQYIEYVYFRYVYTCKKAYQEMYKNRSGDSRSVILKESINVYRAYYKKFKKSEWQSQLSFGKRVSFKIFDCYPRLYSIYWLIKNKLISDLGKLKHLLMK